MLSNSKFLINLKGSSLNFSAHGWWGKEKNLSAKNPARISPKENSGASGGFLPKPLLLRLRHPNSKTNEPKFWQILSQKNSFAKTSSALFRHLPEYLEGRTPKKNVLSIFKKNFTPAKSRKQETFFFGVAEALRGGGGTIRAYDLVSSHHALRACHIICFGNRCEFGTIQTPFRLKSPLIIY